MKTIFWAYTGLLRLMMAAAAVYIGLIMVAIVYITMSREFGWSYSRYIFPAIEFGFIYILALGSPWMVRTRGHVFIELLTAAVPDRVRNVMSRTVAGLSCLICAGLAYYTAKATYGQFLFDEYDQLRADLDIPVWIVSGAIPVGFGLMAVEFALFVFASDPMHSGKAGVVGEDA